MSMKQNDEYIEGKVEDYDYMVARGNWAGALQIIGELKDKGFEEAGKKLGMELARKRLNEN